MKRIKYVSYLWMVLTVFTAWCSTAEPTSTRVCQLTGTDDRSTPGKATGMQLGSVTGGVTGTDIGWPFEHAGRLHFLFGDTRDFNPDLCEPDICGTVQPTPPDGILRWPDRGAYESWLRFHGNAAENMATASLDIDPERCIPLSVFTELRASTFAHAVSSTNVDAAIQLSSPAVAANPQDRFVVTVGKRILVVTDDRRVFAHEVVGNTVGFARQLGTLPPASVGERIVPYRTEPQNWLAMISSDGRAGAVEVRATSLGPFVPFTGPRIAANPQDKWVVSQENRIVVITTKGEVFAHTIEGNVIGDAFRLTNTSGPPVAANPQDKYVLVDGTRILVITNVGDVFMHELTSTTVGPFRPLPGPSKVATSPEDNRVLAMAGRILVLTRADGFRPTRLDHVALGRKEGAFTGFSDGLSMFAFFTKKTWPLGCADPEGCAHDNPTEPGGKSVLARSQDGLGRFDTMAAFSSTKFLFPVPVIAPGSSFPGIPADLAGEQVVFMFGTGRANNAAPAPDPWNESYPYLAVHRLADVASKTGKVFSHPISRSGFGDAVPFGDAVGARPEDKWVLVQSAKDADARVLVITTDGRVFQHPIGSSSLGLPIGVPPESGTIPVAARSTDKWLFAHGKDLLVVTEDGHVFAHLVDDFVHTARELGGDAGAVAPRVGADPGDRWVLVVGDQVLVITDKGKVFGYRLEGDIIHERVELTGSEQSVTGGNRDQWVLGMGNDLIIITGDGRVVTYVVTTISITGPNFILGSHQRVAANPEDRWLLGVGSLDQGGKLLVLPYYASGWRYFAGMGQPWKNEESLAQPLVQLGAPPPGSNIAPGNYHKCLGYFSVRYLEAARKWAMLYTCSNDDEHHRPLRTDARGVFLRTAKLPWGPWSEPVRIFDPGTGYCQFMHLAEADGHCSTGRNPNEGEKRKIMGGYIVGESAGEYAPFLLPSRYAKLGPGGQVDLYYLLSTWNPYQVVLMKTRVAIQ
jgi:hypothetical protein